MKSSRRPQGSGLRCCRWGWQPREQGILSDVTWASVSLRSPTTGLFVQQDRCNQSPALLALEKPVVTSGDGNAFHIAGPLWRESTGDRWIPLTKGQQCEKRYHVIRSSWRHDSASVYMYVPWNPVWSLQQTPPPSCWFRTRAAQAPLTSRPAPPRQLDRTIRCLKKII